MENTGVWKRGSALRSTEQTVPYKKIKKSSGIQIDPKISGWNLHVEAEVWDPTAGKGQNYDRGPGQCGF